MDINKNFTPEFFYKLGLGHLPHHLGIYVTEVDKGKLVAEFQISQQLLAPNDFLHAGSVVALADTAAGYGCVANLPEGASGFTTIELKSNFMGTARSGTVECIATATHLGKSTQVWDATVIDKDSGKTIALFRCTQLILFPKADT
jgi:1,4-dihydroxy-2-naphthoyl-CoA hydrolase